MSPASTRTAVSRQYRRFTAELNRRSLRHSSASPNHRLYRAAVRHETRPPSDPNSAVVGSVLSSATARPFANRKGGGPGAFTAGKGIRASTLTDIPAADWTLDLWHMSFLICKTCVEN